MFACLYVPDFSVQAVLRLEPPSTQETLRRSPVAVLDGPANLPKVTALNQPARKFGIEVGMTKLQVETCGGVTLRKRSLDSEDAAQIALVNCGHSFSPRMESTCIGTVILDLSGTEKLFGTSETTARKISATGAEQGFELRVAVAPNPDTAMYAARGYAGITIIPAHQEAERLASLNVQLLPATPETLEILDGWGIQTFKALAALPEIPLTQRLGQSGLYLQKLAQGRIKRTLVPVEIASTFVESYEFDDPVELLESLAFLLHRLIQQITERLMSQSLATNELRLTLDLGVTQLCDGSKGEQYKREWKLPLPTRDKNMLFSVVRLDLEQTTLTAPVQKITIEAIPIKPRHVQGDLFAPPTPEAEKLEITLARVRGISGTTDESGISCVGSPRVVDSHKPGAFLIQPFLSESRTVENRVLRPVLAPRLFRPPLETSVELSGDRPHLIRLWKTPCRVLAAFGPWCNSGNWWNSATAWVREEWDVVVKTYGDVGYYRIYRDQIKGAWFIEAAFNK
jgi:protein ImuB